MAKKRIVVTGLGIVSCLGCDVNEFYRKLLEGSSGITSITRFPCDDYTTRFGGVVQEFNPEEFLDKKQARRVDNVIAYGIAAGKKALAHARLSSDALSMLDKKRCGIVLGSGMGGMSVFEENVTALREKGVRRVSPFLVPFIIPNMPGALLGMELGFMGPNYSVSTACATANNAIIAAADHIRNGHADLMVSGGAEAPITATGLAGFCACKALSSRNDDPKGASRPWDRDRDGFVMAEGAGVIILESLEHALARNAPIFAEYLGGGISCDAHHMTEPRPDGEGISACLKNAFKDAGITEKEINYVNAHATSTPAGDMVEINAMKKVFSNPSNIVINATKSMIGHSLGAAGGMEAIVAVKAIEEGEVHPTINLHHKEEGIDFHVPTKREKLKIRAALSNSFGFGGHNASVIFAPFAG